MGKSNTILNHHGAIGINYHIDDAGITHIIFEQTDETYNPPYFDESLKCLGGNWEKGANYSDKSPEDTYYREIREEFWEKKEEQESSGGFYNQNFINKKNPSNTKYNKRAIDDIKQIPKILLENVEHCADYVVTLQPPITKDTLKHGLTVFQRELDESEFNKITKIIDEYNGALTTDNLKWGSKIVCMTIDEINEYKIKTAGGQNLIINNLITSKILPDNEKINIRPNVKNLINISRIKYPSDGELTESGCPTFKGFEDMGYRYLINGQ